MKSFLRWSPRILTLLIACLLALFALDALGKDQGLWATVLDLVVQLVPSVLVLLALVFSWRRPLVGAVVFLGLAALYPFLVLVTLRLSWTAMLLIGGPLLLAGVLFLVDWLATRRRHHRPASGS